MKTMTNRPTEAQLMEMYRRWWQDSYGSVPNAQATVVAAAWARHVLDTLSCKPISMEERQPTKSDCGINDMLWFWDEKEFVWELCDLEDFFNEKPVEFTHWLPYSALVYPLAVTGGING